MVMHLCVIILGVLFGISNGHGWGMGWDMMYGHNGPFYNGLPMPTMGLHGGQWNEFAPGIPPLPHNLYNPEQGKGSSFSNTETTERKKLSSKLTVYGDNNKQKNSVSDKFIFAKTKYGSDYSGKRGEKYHSGKSKYGDKKEKSNKSDESQKTEEDYDGASYAHREVGYNPSHVYGPGYGHFGPQAYEKYRMINNYNRNIDTYGYDRDGYGFDYHAWGTPRFNLPFEWHRW
ncbi:unnamed protein product [Dicrocoelium dendriticum]|nr:unnamed protein product [Dicrocoelium dendriticum]